MREPIAPNPMNATVAAIWIPLVSIRRECLFLHVEKTAHGVGPVMSRLSEYMAGARERPLPAAVLEKTKHHVLNTFAAMVSGAGLLPGRKALEFARAYAGPCGGAAPCGVVASDIACGPIEAALANGVLAHADETDDSHGPGRAHPGCATVPAALAVGEQLGT